METMSCFFGAKSWITESAGPVGKDVLMEQPEQPEQPEPEPFKSPHVRKSEISAWCVIYLSYRDGSKPWYLVNPKIAGKWMFIPLKMYL